MRESVLESAWIEDGEYITLFILNKVECINGIIHLIKQNIMEVLDIQELNDELFVQIVNDIKYIVENKSGLSRRNTDFQVMLYSNLILCKNEDNSIKSFINCVINKTLTDIHHFIVKKQHFTWDQTFL